VTSTNKLSIDLVSLVGDRVLVLHAPPQMKHEAGLSGLDIDCDVQGLDPLWPLRLSDGWRLCQSVQYDLRGWWRAIERRGTPRHRHA
jgi:hypothetical protein